MTYNGWKNKETWIVNLWLNEDSWGTQCIDLCIRENDDAVGTAESLKCQVHDRLLFHAKYNGFLGDMLNLSLEEVNWLELAKYYIEEK